MKTSVRFLLLSVLAVVAVAAAEEIKTSNLRNGATEGRDLQEESSSNFVGFGFAFFRSFVNPFCLLFTLLGSGNLAQVQLIFGFQFRTDRLSE